MAEVIYLTGIPGTGKTTVGRELESASDGRIVHFPYSERLALKARATHDELRAKSATLITREMVHDTDQELVELVSGRDPQVSVVLDSHAVTYETYGLRVIPFTPQRLVELGLTAVVCLTASPELIVSRVATEPAGRPLQPLAKVGQALTTQTAVAVNYSVQLGVPLHVVDTDRPQQEVIDVVRAIVVR